MNFLKRTRKLPRKKIGLALGSGGAHGLAHIGVIKTLLENNIPIDCIAGASAGALFGGLYAANKDIDAVERIALTSDVGRLTHFILDVSSHGGLLSGDAIEQFIRKELDGITFDELHIPFAAVATDIHTGDAVVLRDGDVTSAIRASMSIPIIFEPVLYGERTLVDGGLVMPVPVELVRSMGADIVIGVNLDTPCPHGEHDETPSLKMVMEMTIEILRNNLSETQAQTADVVVSPQFDKKIFVGWEDFLHAEDFIAKGQSAMEAALPELKRMLSSER
jgi:NTE family protein